MQTVLLMVRLFLAVILGIAAIGKAADPAGGRKALAGFGVSESLATPLGWCLLFVEIVVALALIPAESAWLGAIAAMGLMLIFAMAIAVNLVRGRTPECNCFGQLHSRPVSWSMFARNVLLAAVAALVVVQGKEGAGPSPLIWVADLRAAETVSLAVSVAIVGLLVAAIVYLRRVLHQQTKVLARIDAMERAIEDNYSEAPVERKEVGPPVEGLPVGSPAPSFALASLGGEEVTLEELLAYGNPVLLIFVSPSCSPCEALFPAVAQWDGDYDDRLTVVLISKGSQAENQNIFAKYGARHVLLAGESDVAEVYEGRWTPAAVLISRQGTIASQNQYGGQSIRDLVTRLTAADVASHDGNGSGGHGHGLHIPVGSSLLEVGDPAPAFSIPDLHGVVVKTEDLLGSDTLMLFWDPGCGFCQAMSDDLKDWEASPPTGAPQLVFVAKGELDAVKADSESYDSRFLYDREQRLGSLFGARVTPSALLIDRDGKIASSMATGSSNVLALAGILKVVRPGVSGLSRFAQKEQSTREATEETVAG